MKTYYGITYKGQLILGSIHHTEQEAKDWIEADQWTAWELLVGKRQEPFECVEVNIEVKYASTST